MAKVEQILIGESAIPRQDPLSPEERKFLDDNFADIVKCREYIEFQCAKNGIEVTWMPDGTYKESKIEAVRVIDSCYMSIPGFIGILLFLGGFFTLIGYLIHNS